MSAQGLDVSDVVSVSVNLTSVAVPQRNFGAMMVVGSSDVIDTNERLRDYSSIDEVVEDFATSTPEYAAAALHFGQSPQPSILYIGRWAQTATHGRLNGAVLPPTQQVLSLFTAVSSGTLEFLVDGLPRALTGLDFSAQTNLNGVASVLQTALAAISTGATVKWNSVQSRFEFRSGSTGAASSLSYGRSPTAVGYLSLTGQPSAADSFTLNGSAVSFVATGATGLQVNIGADVAHTLANLLTVLQASADTQLVKFRYYSDGISKLYVESATTGTGGNALTLAKSGTNLAVSAATLAGGSGTDVSTLLGATQASGASAPVPGLAAETILNAITTLADMSAQWYGVSVASSPMPADADNVAVAGFIEAAGKSRVFGITAQNTNVLDGTNSSDIASQLKALGYRRTFVQYSSWSPYAAASWLGRNATIDFTANNTVITMKFKQEPGIVAEFLTETQAAALKAKNCNVFVNYDNGVAIIQEGVMANGFFFDEIQDTDWLQNAIQTNVWNLLYTSPTKIPQTDAGNHDIVAVVENTLVQSVNNGTVAPGVWQGPPIGQVNTGDVLPKGFYVYAPPIASQSQGDRQARKSVPIQVLIVLAGAIHFVNVLVTVTR